MSADKLAALSDADLTRKLTCLWPEAEWPWYVVDDDGREYKRLPELEWELAGAVLERMRERGFYPCLHVAMNAPDRWTAGFYKARAPMRIDECARDKTAPRAVVVAAILACQEER